MKFGSQILDKSVPEWKLNNIDYEELKKIIKQITNGKGPYKLEDFEGLTVKFTQNFNQVNLFINLKVKEISSKLVSIETSISRLFDDSLDAGLLKRRVRAIKVYLENCNTLLQKLSRFVIVQRVGLRKLFKKIKKHYQDSEIAREYIAGVKRCKELQEGYEGISFQQLDLQPYLVEVSLIMDVLSDISMKLKQDGTLDGMEKTDFDRSKLLDRKSSQKTPEDVKVNLKTNSQFDAFFLEKCETLQRILIRSDNNEQLKFLLINLGYQVFDESLLKRSREIIHQESASETRSLKSMKSFYDNERPPLRRLQTGSSEAIKQTDDLEQGSSSISILSRHPKLSENNFSNENENRFPNLVIEYYKHKVPIEECILMCHVGGLRGSIVTNSLTRTEIIKILQKDDSAKVTDAIGKLASEWIISHELKACSPRINYKRTRYISIHKSNLYLITIDDQISLGTKDGDESPIFDHSIMEIKRFPIKKDSTGGEKDARFVAIMEKMYESKIQCIPFRQTLTVWKLMARIVDSEQKIDSLKSTILEDIYTIGEGDSLSDDEFFGIGLDILLNLCSKQFQNEQYSLTREASKTPSDWKNQRNISPESKGASAKPSKFRYWNEFDELEEENLQNNFYQQDNEGDLEINDSGNHHDFGFVHLSNDFINSTYDFAQQIRQIFGFDDGSESLLNPALRDLSAKYGQRNYGSISSGQSVATKSYDDIRILIEHQKKDLKDSEAMYEYKHDQVLSLMYLFVLLIACVTSGVCMGIVLAVFTDDDSDVDLVVGNTLILTIITSLTLSLILVILCLLLLFSRYTFAPIWHYILSFTLFVMIMGTVCYGLVEILL
ncbi:hypothetical protein RNJ44_00400 [Nakaseomyces bracarensis]|uniref:SPX domain-containing protein n=1 Tax=Nakaseomyces bracarensis TaxID=273131 RepID=A0ABR4NSG1_9SACH